MSQVIAITGAATGFGALMARHLAQAGHIMYATMHQSDTKNARHKEETLRYAAKHKVDLRVVELDVLDSASIEAAIAQILADAGQLDCLVHNAGHMCLGAAEAFTAEDFMSYYDINVLGAQRVNRAALPHMRRAGKGLLVWIGSSSTGGGTPPFLAPYFAAKAAMDSLAVSYASELSLWGIESTIIIPGAYHSGTEHFNSAGRPSDTETQKQYDDGAYRGIAERALRGFQKQEDADSDIADVAKEIVRVVDLPHGRRPFRVHVDPCHQGAEELDHMGNFVRRMVLEKADLADLLKVKVS